MNRTAITLLGIFSTTFIFAQPGITKPASTGKIVIAPGQKITVASSISVDADLSMGMQLSSTSTSENLLEAKSSTDKTYIISNTLTKVKVNMNMMGQPTSYDSEKKEGNNPEVANAFDDKLNKPVDVTIDNATGAVVKDDKKVKEKSSDDENTLNGLLDMFAENSDDAVVSGAFELVPQGKNIGDSWVDSTVSKEMKAGPSSLDTFRRYYGPTMNAFEAADKNGRAADLQRELEALFESQNKSTNKAATVIPATYLKVSVARS